MRRSGSAVRQGRRFRLRRECARWLAADRASTTSQRQPRGRRSRRTATRDASERCEPCRAALRPASRAPVVTAAMPSSSACRLPPASRRHSVKSAACRRRNSSGGLTGSTSAGTSTPRSKACAASFLTHSEAIECCDHSTRTPSRFRAALDRAGRRPDRRRCCGPTNRPAACLQRARQAARDLAIFAGVADEDIGHARAALEAAACSATPATSAGRASGRLC